MGLHTGCLVEPAFTLPINNELAALVSIIPQNSYLGRVFQKKEGARRPLPLAHANYFRHVPFWCCRVGDQDAETVSLRIPREDVMTTLL